MEGTYPVVIDGELVGKLSVRTEGGRTSFDISTVMLEGIVRVSVYGADKEGYLGVLIPENGGLGLHKKFSRTQLRDFPTEIEAAERAGNRLRQHEVQENRTTDEAAEQFTAEQQEAPVPEEPLLPQAEEERYWYASPDGALVRFDGVQNLIALPVGDPRMPEQGGEPCVVEGREYMVFRTRHGRLLY